MKQTSFKGGLNESLHTGPDPGDGCQYKCGGAVIGATKRFITSQSKSGVLVHHYYYENRGITKGKAKSCMP